MSDAWKRLPGEWKKDCPVCFDSAAACWRCDYIKAQGRIIELEADLKVEKSRVAAYQATCDQQGRKLATLETVLVAESEEAAGTTDTSLIPLASATFKSDTLFAIRTVLLQKG